VISFVSTVGAYSPQYAFCQKSVALKQVLGKGTYVCTYEIFNYWIDNRIWQKNNLRSNEKYGQCEGSNEENKNETCFHDIRWSLKVM